MAGLKGNIERRTLCSLIANSRRLKFPKVHISEEMEEDSSKPYPNGLLVMNNLAEGKHPKGNKHTCEQVFLCGVNVS